MDTTKRGKIVLRRPKAGSGYIVKQMSDIMGYARELESVDLYPGMRITEALARTMVNDPNITVVLVER